MDASTGAVVHTDVVVMNVPSIGGVRYLVFLNNEASRHVQSFQMMLKGEEADLLKLQTSCVL